MRNRIICILILALAVFTANAQDFDPQPPSDPNFMCKVKVVAQPVEAGYTYGSGYYQAGTQIYISTSSRGEYNFKHWELDGKVYSTDTGFYFTVGDTDVNLVAVYEPIPYEPSLPGDPNAPIDVSRLYVECIPSDGGSLNLPSGQRYDVDTWVYLTAYVNQGFVFKGWYDENNVLLSQSTDFNYLIGLADATVTARYEYAPTLPGDPGSTGQEDVANTSSADITGDGEVDVQDVVACINIVLSGEENNKADISGDGTIDVQDVVSLINIILKNK